MAYTTSTCKKRRIARARASSSQRKTDREREREGEREQNSGTEWFLVVVDGRMQTVSRDVTRRGGGHDDDTGDTEGSVG